jgi:tRNA G37 N-methylase Trm5
VSERKYLPKLVQDDEIIIDMFAGIGYFSLAIAKFSSPKMIYSIELNPVSFEYLVKNIEINKLVQKITPISGDSAIEVPKLSERGIKADRIIMGVFPAPFELIKPASTIIKSEKLTIISDLTEFQEHAKNESKFDIYNRIDKACNNTIIHFEGVTMGKRIDELFNKFEANMNELGYKVSLLAFRFVKSFGPKMWHLVLDIAVGL